MRYSDTAELLHKPENVGKDFIIEFDAGIEILTHEEALEAWEDIAPGEAFHIIRIGDYL